MKVFNRASKITLVFCTGNGECPRMLVSARDVKFADDYSGNVKTNKKLLSKFFSK